METIRNAITTEFESGDAKENPQVLLSICEVLIVLFVGILGSCIPALATALSASIFILVIAVLLCIIIPFSTKIDVIYSSNVIRNMSFYLFNISMGVVLAYISSYLSWFFLGIWMYLATGLLLFYEYNRISPDAEVRKSFKFVVFGLVVISCGIELVLICQFFSAIVYFLCLVRNI